MSTDDDYPTDLTDEPWELLHPLLPERTWRPAHPDDRHATCDVGSTASCTSTRRAANGVWCPRTLVTGAPSMALVSAGAARASGHA